MPLHHGRFIGLVAVWISPRLTWLAILTTSFFVIGCVATPNFEEAATSYTGAAGADSLSIRVPPGTSEPSDLLIAVLGVQGNPNTSGPDGWTAVPGFAGFNGTMCQADGQGTACQLAVYTKIADGSETNAVFSWGGTQRAAGAVLRFSEVDSSAPIGVARSQRGSSAFPIAPRVTTTRDGSRVLRIVVCEFDDARLFGSPGLTDEPPTMRLNTVSFPDAMTDPVDGCGPPLSACDAMGSAVGLAVSDTRHATAGASGPATWALPWADQWVAASIELKHVPGP